MSNEKVAPLMTFTGPAGRTYWDKDGVLQTAGENELRKDYCQRTGRYRGILLEQGSANIITSSEDISSNEWVKNSNLIASTPSFGMTPLEFTGVVSDARLALYNETQGWSVGESVVIRARFEPLDACETIGLGWAFSSSECSWVAYNTVTGAVSTDGSSYKHPEFVSAIELSAGIWELTIIGREATEAGTMVVLYFGEGNANDLRANSGLSSCKIGFVQCEKGKNASSYIYTNGGAVTRDRDDARFTDPSVFNNFERGTFVIGWETFSNKPTSNSYILSPAGSNYEFLGQRAASGEIDGEHFTYIGSGYVEYPTLARNISAVSWDGVTVRTSSNGSEVHEFEQTRQFPASNLEIGGRQNTWSGWIRQLPFNPEALTDEQFQRLTAVPRRTTIASGQILADYDPNERLSLFQDRHGIKPVERDGDPVRFMLDLGPNGNHLQAAPESTGLIYRTDGERAWIECNGENDYFQYRAGALLHSGTAIASAAVAVGVNGAFEFRSGAATNAPPLTNAASFAEGDPFRIGGAASRIGRVTITAGANQADRDAIDAEIIDRYVSA